MDEALKQSVLAVCTLLQRFQVRYMLVGGAAVALHGYYRHSMGPTGELTSKPDIDLWYEPSYENYFKLVQVLKTLSDDASEIENEDRPDPKRSFFRLDLGEFTLDALPVISADIAFREAYSRKEEVLLDGIPIYYISYDDLLIDKERSARKKDKEDLQRLKGDQETDRSEPE